MTLARFILVSVSALTIAGGVCAQEPAKAPAPINLRAGPAVTAELVDAVTRADAALFAAAFDTCDVDALAGMVTDDFEFFHDKDGLIATSGQQFIDAVRGQCERKRQGTDFLSRRELIAAGMRVYPLNNYGAVQVGEHRFYAIAEGQADRLTETAKFTHVWKQGDDGWRLARVLSYDHVLAE